MNQPMNLRENDEYEPLSAQENPDRVTLRLRATGERHVFERSARNVQGRTLLIWAQVAPEEQDVRGSLGAFLDKTLDTAANWR